jgi:hypothetical protein
MRQKLGRQEIDRRRAEPARDITVRRRLVDFAWRADLQKLAIPNDADARSHGHGFDLVMGHIKDRCTELDLNALELEAQFGAQLGIERRERLVHQINRRIAHQGAADRDPLHLAAGQPRSAIAELAGDVQKLGRLLDALSDQRLRHMARRRAQRKGEIVVYRQVRIERVLLKDEGDVARSRRIAGHVAPIDQDRADIGPFKPGDEPKRRGLAGTART